MKVNIEENMNFRFLQKLALLGILLSISILFGCADKRIYTPYPLPIKSGMVPESNLAGASPVSIINGQSKNWEKIGKYRHKWDVDLNRWAQSAVIVTRKEFERQGVEITDTASKKLILSMDDPELYWDFRGIRCTAYLEVETGDGYENTYTEVNFSIDLYGSCDGALTRSVASMLNDPKIVGYLKPVVNLKDSDKDGVPDEQDACPLTPSDVEVDTDGCPLDSDGDGISDYQDHCQDTVAGISVDFMGCPSDTDNDGVADYLDQCLQTPPGDPVGPDGCPLDSDNDGVTDERDQCPRTPLGARVDDIGCWNLGATLFDFNSSKLKESFFPALNEIVDILKKNPGLKIEIQGHTDDVGSEVFNKTLSEKRAKTVMEYLIDKGIEPNRLAAKGFGFSQPKVDAKTEEARSQNRRVLIVPTYENPSNF